MPRSRYRLALVSLAVLAAPLVAHADPLYAITPIGAAGTHATGINNSGQVVGYFSPGAGVEHAFLYSAGTFLDLGTLGGTNSSATGINDAGWVVGSSGTASGQSHGFVYALGSMTDLGTLGGPSSGATSINGSGQVVGSADLASGSAAAFIYSGGAMQSLGTLPGGLASRANDINSAGQVTGGSFAGPPEGSELAFHAFLYSGGAMSDLGTLGGQFSVGSAINDSGQVAGWSGTPALHTDHAFLYCGGTMTDLGTLAGIGSSAAYDINNAGQVVGWSEVADRESRAFLYQDGSLVDLNTLIDPASGWTLDAAYAINDQHQIVAYGCKAGLCQSLRLDLVPAVPEPQALAMLLAGFGLLGWRSRARGGLKRSMPA